MDRRKNQIEFLSHVAGRLGDLKDEVVFVGGAICGLLITDFGGFDVRPTDDVDFIVKVTTYAPYVAIQEKLRSRGFKDVVDKEGPICRMKIDNIIVDVLPENGEFLGFKNYWYSRAIETAEHHTITVEAQATTIKVVNAPLFICTKLEAFKDRGKGDYMASRDIEDVIAVLNGRKELWKECWLMPADVRGYLKKTFLDLLNDDDFLEAMPGMLPYGSAGRENVILRRMSSIAEYLLDTSFSGQIKFAFGAEGQDALEAAINTAHAFSGDLNFPTRIFKDQEEMFQMLSELKIADDGDSLTQKASTSVNLVNAEIQILSKWGILPPYLDY